MKRVLTTILLLLGLALAGGVAYQSGAFSSLLGTHQTDNGPTVSKPQDNGPASSKRGVVALGRVEPARGIIDIAALAGDRVETIEVEEGKPVTKDQVLARLESRSLRKLEFESIDSQVQEAEARQKAEEALANTRITGADLAVQKAEATDEDVTVQESKVEVAEANHELAVADSKRLEELRQTRPGLVSDQEWQRQQLLKRQAEAELTVAKAMLQKLNRTRKLSLQAAQADLDAAEASKDQVLKAIPVASLKKQRALAQEQHRRTEITAPCDGKVLKIFMREGETIAHRPILQLANLQSMVVIAEVYETDARRVRKGQKALITSKALPAPCDETGLTGKVERIAGLITTPELKSLNPLAKSDRRVVEVRILLDPESSKQAARLVNLQVDVTILPDGDYAPQQAAPQEP